MKKLILSLALISFCAIAFTGCNTIKGTAKGAAEDFSKGWQAAKKIDDWLQKHAW